MAREQRFHLVFSFGAMLIASLAAAATPVTLYFDDQSRYEREIAPGEIHPYVITLKAGEFVRFIAWGEGVNIALAFESEAGNRLFAVDQLNTISDPETLSAISPTDGRYRLLVSVSPRWKKAGSYEVHLDDRRPAVPQDRDRIEAQRLFMEAENVRSPETAESYRAAEDLYRRAFLLSQLLHDDASASDTLNNVGFVTTGLGESREALEAFLGALAIRDCVGGQRPRAGVLSNIAVVLQDLGQDRKSIAFSEAAMRDPSTDLHINAISVYMIGQAYSKLGEEKTALEYYLRALPLAVQSGDRVGQARNLNRIGSSYANLGQWRDALLYYGRSLVLRRATGDRRGEASTLANIGSLYEAWGDTERALDHYQKILTASKETRDLRMEAVALHRIGNIHLVRGAPDRAIRYYEQALKLYRQARYRSDEAMALLGLGKATAAKGDFTAALAYFEEALSTSRDRLQRALIVTAIADAQLGAGNIDETIASANEGIDIFHAAGNQQGEAEAVYVRAKAFESAGKLAEARRDAERSLQVIERLRGNIGTFESRALFLASYSDISELYVRVLMRLHSRERSGGFDALALQASERARARTLSDYLSEASGKRERPEQRALVARQRDIRALLSAKAEAQLKAMGSKSAQEVATAIGREMDELSVEYDQVAARLRDTASTTESLSVPAIQRDVADSTTALLEYSLGKDRSFLWLVTPASLRSYELPKRETIEAEVRKAYEAVTTRASSHDALDVLSRMILAPAAAELTAKRLLIVSDGALHYVPFAAMPSPRDPTRPLIADYEIVNIPSASTVPLLRHFPRRSAATKTLAIFADPVFDRNDERVRPNMHPLGIENALETDVVRSAQESGLAGSTLPRLPFTRREANALLALVNPDRRKAALDFQASRKTALGRDLADYRIVHFATHGLLNSLHPELSGIILSLVDEKGNEQRGFLAVADVMNMSLRADLVVLSGCRTALGKEIKGEGISGLTRAFMYAGAPREVASLWKVSDAATAELMKKFYAAMLGPRKLSAAAALRAAQRSLWSEQRWNDPD
jgi:CHAT domain-containing protein/predicted negative regulator of RcsB-dependent stress response